MYNFLMRIAILGANGQLGNYISRSLSGHNIKLFTRDNIRLTCKKDTRLKLKNFDVVINCAAFTNTQRAQHDNENFKVNYKAVKFLRKGFKGLLINISTQWVFPPSNEENLETSFIKTKPKTKYGLAKWKADKFLLRHGGNFLVIRPGWLHSSGKQNFITKMNSFNRDEYSIVTDDISQLTTGKMILEVIERALVDNTLRGFIQVASEEHISRYDLYKKYCEFTNKKVKLNKVTSKDINVDLSKTNYQFMDVSKYKSLFDVKDIDSIIKDWIKEEEWKQ